MEGLVAMVTSLVAARFVLWIAEKASEWYAAWQSRRYVSLRLSPTDTPYWNWAQAWLQENAEKMTLDRRHVMPRRMMGTKILFAAACSPTPLVYTHQGRRFEIALSFIPKDQREQRYMETTSRQVLISTRGKDTAVFASLLNEMKAAYARESAGRVEIYMPTVNHQAYWTRIRYATPRSWANVILAPDLDEALRGDLDAFLKPDARARYEALGLAYRRGWLLHGPPGNGKSSTIAAIAARLQSPVYVLNLGNKKILDTDLATLMNDCVTDGDATVGLLVLEDIDALFTDARKADAAAGISFSGLLNVLDGAAAPENILIVATTNHPERLDPALKRPGRMDKFFEFKPPTDADLARLYLRFHPDAVPDEAQSFIARCRADTEPVSFARAQALAHAV
jgi:hypothetical protein